ncbi:replication protein A 14 kDa subunit [Latimeria chalumnae]|uniref:Replication protein A3 n=1 Tax=Latimeria chalumnae TaxID=7897 RepID=H3AKT1_LATCH|nr:PREDICTED: replication protein A 14 kDa subunit [Latimeria chalumnae]|eukprot:XP_005999520.1 PREDICTED: replication protein A 14 kDa subunit [Latimeria chalumnae]
MEDVSMVTRTRINSSMLAQYIGKPVCFIGRVKQIHPTGTSLVLSDGEGKNATIELSEPLENELSGIIEVVGRVTSKATIAVASYLPFREDKDAFDLELYNETLKVIHEFPHCYPFSVTSSE